MQKSKYTEEVINPGNAASKLAKKINIASYNNSPAVIIIPQSKGDHFRGAVDYLFSEQIQRGLLESVISYKSGGRHTLGMGLENDGAGGKPQFFTLRGDIEGFYGLGWEIICMCADDFVRNGRMPLIMVNEVQVKKITAQSYPLFESMMGGYGDALKKTSLVNITGETAIMKHSITAFCDTGGDAQLILLTNASILLHLWYTRDITLYTKSYVTKTKNNTLSHTAQGSTCRQKKPCPKKA